MQVLTLDERNLDIHAKRLAEIVKKGDPDGFDAIVAIRRGGSFVCDAFCRHYSSSLYDERFDITLQRPSTKRKGNGVSHFLKRLPYPLLDLMRMAESYILSMHRRTSSASPTRAIDMPEGMKKMLSKNRTKKILIIDDAIDSGDTLSAIIKTLKKTNPKIKVTSAVLTETTKNPAIRADYTLYRNQTLIRFPWSNDYRKKH